MKGEQEQSNLRDKINSIPELPGVYIFKDNSNRIIYVGKSRNLKERVRSYFYDDDTRYQIRFMKDKITDVEFIITGTEKEALVLENEFIKKYKPTFNIKLKDDKSFVYIKINLAHDFPGIYIERKPERGNSIIFGPYSSASMARRTLKLLLKVFPLRSCSDEEFKRRKRPCVLYEIGECSGPCAGYVGKEKYKELLENIIQFFRGKRNEILSKLKEDMLKFSKEERFEEAAIVRDKIRALEKTLEAQRVVSEDDTDRDVFAVANSGDSYCVGVLNVRQGVLQNVRNIFIKKSYLSPESLLESVVSQYYDSGNFIPDEIILDREIESVDSYELRFRELSGYGVKIIIPARGFRKELLDLAITNAQNFLSYKLKLTVGIQDVLNEIKDVLNIPRMPEIIECIDISNISGRYAVGAKVAFSNGVPDRSLYRLYRIKTVGDVDDYGMMYEVLKRRITRGIQEDDLPDLMLVDGGKGHLNVALTVLKENKVDDVSVVGMAKGEREHFYLPGVMNPVFFKSNSPALLLLQRIRDEAHRFAIKYHRKLRSKGYTHSILDDIPGIGEKRKKALLRAFGSVEMLKKASVEEIIKAANISKKVAERIFEALH